MFSTFHLSSLPFEWTSYTYTLVNNNNIMAVADHPGGLSSWILGLVKCQWV